jgi:hypothetical protein
MIYDVCVFNTFHSVPVHCFTTLEPLSLPEVSITEANPIKVLLDISEADIGSITEATPIWVELLLTS